MWRRIFVVDNRFFRKFVVDARKFVVDARKFVVDDLCKILQHNVLCYAVKVTKKKLKITVKQWSVSFLVYRGRFAPLFSVFFDTTNFRRMGETGNK